MPRQRKQHSQDAGYIAERMNPVAPGKKVVIYLASAQDFDESEGKYAVVCDAHGTVANTDNEHDARVLMKAPENFCEKCELMREAQQI